ncbi:MAG: hypothetical protein JST93_10095 [Acidobacteria bacterium]|nr:hypothetical protein [Acidobacteriota bacterium]
MNIPHKKYSAGMMVLFFILFPSVPKAHSQDTSFSNSAVPLTATDVKTVTLPPNSASTTLDIVVSPASSNVLDILSEAGVVVSLLQPGGVEVNAANAVSLGYEWSSIVSNPTTRPVSPLEFPGLHNLVTLPSSAPAGIYTVKLNASQLNAESSAIVTYQSGSSLQAGLAAGAPTYRIGQAATLTAMLFENVTPISGASASARLLVTTDASGQASVQNIQLVSTSPGPGGMLTEVYSASLVNSGPALTRARASVLSAPTTVSRATLYFGEVAANSTAAALNTFSIERLPSQAFNPAAIQWRVETTNEIAPVSFSDSGPFDAQSGDGLYTGSFTPSIVGVYTALLRATGSSPAGAPFSRSASASFEVRAPSAVFVSFQHQAIDDNANSLTDRIRVTANLSVSTAGVYGFQVRLKAPNGQSIHSLAKQTLATGSTQLGVDFSASSIIESLGVNGPFELIDAVLLQEESAGGFASVDAKDTVGTTSAMPISSFDRGVLYFTGPVSAAPLSTDGAPLFNVLRLSVGVYYATGGVCSWSGRLSNWFTYSVEYANGGGTLSPGANTVILDFSGARIAAEPNYRPRKLEDFSIRCGARNIKMLSVAENSTDNIQFRPGAMDFSLAASPVSATLAAGSTQSVSVSVSSTGPFLNPITPSITGLPAGVTVQFGPQLLLEAPGTVVVFFHAMPSAIVGTYTPVFTANGGGVQKNLPIPLTITPLAGKSVSAFPVGPEFKVNGASHTMPATFQWATGSNVSLTTDSPQTISFIGSSRYTFLNWSDGGAISHTVTAQAGVASYVANFTAEHTLVVKPDPPAGGTVSPSGELYYPAGVLIPVQAVPNPGYAFSSWSGGTVSGGAQGTIALSAPTALTANFVPTDPFSSTSWSLTGKSGPANHRNWTFRLTNVGTGGLYELKLVSWQMTQRTGPPCSPSLLTPLPMYIGDIAPGASLSYDVAINTTGCDPAATFLVVGGYIRNRTNAGAAHGVIVSP